MSLYIIIGIMLIASATAIIITTSYITFMMLILIYIYNRTANANTHVDNTPMIDLNNIMGDDPLDGTVPIIYDAVIDEDISDADTNISENDDYHRTMHERYYSNNDTTHWVSGYTPVKQHRPPRSN